MCGGNGAAARWAVEEEPTLRESRYHVDRRVEDLIRAGLSGVAQVQETVRDAWIWRWLAALVRDVRYAVRSLTRSWGFALGAGAVLALAIGASTAMPGYQGQSPLAG